MGDFFLLQMDDFFTEGLCFDTSKEGAGERRFGAPPFCEGQSEGPEPREVEGTGRMRETGASSTEEVATHLWCCACRTGGSHARTPHDPAQRGVGQSERPRQSGANSAAEGLGKGIIKAGAP